MLDNLKNGFIGAVWVAVMSFIGMWLTRILFPEVFLASVEYMDFVTIGLFVRLVSPSTTNASINHWKES